MSPRIYLHVLNHKEKIERIVEANLWIKPNLEVSIYMEICVLADIIIERKVVEDTNVKYNGHVADVLKNDAMITFDIVKLPDSDDTLICFTFEAIWYV